MTKASKLLLRLVALCLRASVIFVLDAERCLRAVAQLPGAGQHAAHARAERRFRSLDDINDQHRQAQQDVQQAESQYVRDGCNAAAKAGQPLNAQCRAEARTVLAARDALQAVSQPGRHRQRRRPAARGGPAGDGALQLQRAARARVGSRSQRAAICSSSCSAPSRTASATATRRAATSSRASRATTRSAPCACARPTATTGRSAIRR